MIACSGTRGPVSGALSLSQVVLRLIQDADSGRLFGLAEGNYGYLNQHRPHA
jgi:hypothetical protein